MERSLPYILIMIMIHGSAIGAPDPATLPVPPSVAVNPAPQSPDAKIRFLVNSIPSTAKYIVYGQMDLHIESLTDAQAPQLGRELSDSNENFVAIARQQGANLIVLLSNEHGVPIHIRQSEQPMILRRERPIVTAILFVWSPSTNLSDKERRVRFVTDAKPKNTKVINFTIELSVDTAGITKSYWTYGNISRFVTEAIANNLDTISFESSHDASVEDVWLPGCDSPLKVSLTKPKLVVSIFKKDQSNDARLP